MGKKYESPNEHILSPGRKPHSSFLFQLSYVNKCPFLVYFVPYILCCLSVVLLFKMTSKHSAEMLSDVPKCRNSVMCHMEKMPGLEKLSFRHGLELLTMTSMLINQQDIFRCFSTEKHIKQDHVVVV